MEPSKIRNIVKEEMDRESTYGSPKIYPHDHDGNNSPAILSPSFTYIGHVPYIDDSTLPFVLPRGWRVIYYGSGVYEIIHNLWTRLGIKFYSCVTNAAQSTNEVVASVVTAAPDSVTISWFKTTDAAAQDTSFDFQITIVNTLIKNQVQYNTGNLGI